MNRIRGDSWKDFDAAEWGKPFDAATDGFYRMKLRKGTAYRLRKLLKNCAYAPFLAQCGLIETALQACAAERSVRLPGTKGTPRILRIARRLAAQGERRLDPESVEAEIAALDAGNALEMREIMALPFALRIAMCEGLLSVAETARRIESAQTAAEKWVNVGGSTRWDCDAVFFEHAARLCMRADDAETYAGLTQRIRESGQRLEWLVERAHRIEADAGMRLDNLLHLMRILGATDWSKRLKRISATEEELNADEIYARSDDDTRAQVRAAVGEIARALREPEIVVVRRALQLRAQENTATACVYFLEDAGRRRLCASFDRHARIRRVVPDPTGRIAVCILTVMGTSVLGIAALLTEEKWLLLLVPPVAWVAAERIAARLLPKLVRPLRLPKLKLDAVPQDARTLVVLPVLLSSAARAREAVARMETLGCLEKDENVDYLLLGDGCDADSGRLPEDAEIAAAAETGIAALNRHSEREKYFFLIRRREYREKDRRWMGENRKRGALVALNRLLLGGNADVFVRGNLPKRGYRYVVTLDSDTEYLPGTVHKLVGAMLHPLNARYAVLQPDMQLTADAADNLFVRTVYGTGGLDAYPTAVSGFFQDLCGRGSFAGKGIYEIRRFAEATDGALPDAEILSHDLIEGILAGAGNLCDVHFYDGCPENLRADLRRAHRWTRGDWQLLRVLFRARMAAADRIRIVGNLLRSLFAPGMTLLLILSAWLDAPKAFLFALAAAYLEPLLHPFGTGMAWRRSTLELALLPVRGFFALDAALRSVWRLLVSRKHLMDWIPSAEASGGAKHISLPGRIAAILVLPALLRPLWLPAALALAALFWIGSDWADDLSRAERSEPLSEIQIRDLKALGRRTWRFFEDVVPENGNGLPPDNLQVDPPVGAAHRTSPTNIGLYLMSCLAAEKLGYIDGETMLRRMRACVATLESLEKWNGQLYNWYDTDTRAPMRPRYISSVDGGNLAAALLLCAQAAPDASLSARLWKLAEEMDFRTLYDETRDLFVIGVDVESGSVSHSYYDLYASESRILSFAAMMLGQAPTRHWQRLGRPEARFGKHCALLSWSGTMFEYLMPELIFGSPARSLAGRTCRSVVEMQMAHGRRLNLPWGVSESGCCAFDRSLNYQYHAFGLRELALSDAARAEVIAPYAAALALAVRPAAAAENLARMAALNLAGEYGLYEAADNRDGAVRVVRSYMAHHQGMLLCAICNALTENALQRMFMDIPQAKALRLLLQEKAGAHVRKRAPQKRQPYPRRLPSLAYVPAADGEIQLLHGAGTTALVSSRGAVFARSGDLLWNRFSGDLLSTHEGLYVHLRVDGKDVVIADAPEFDAGCARFRAELGGISAQLTVTVSPETGALFLIVDLKNLSDVAQEAEVAACAPIALAEERDMRAHPVFQNLFVESAPIGANGIAFRRRLREAGKELPKLFFVCTENAEAETDLDALTGRRGACGRSGGIAERFTGTLGCVLNPCAALKTRVRLEKGAERKLHFAMYVSERETELTRAGRALQLARTQARSLVEFSFENPEEYRLCQRAAALLFDARQRPQIDGAARDPAPRELLWSAGISGDLPILAARIEENTQMPLVGQLLRLREFTAMMGVRTDLALIAQEGGDYRGELAKSLRLAAGDDAHVFVLDTSDADLCAAVTRAAALCFSGMRDLRTQLREIVDARRGIDGCAYAPMEARKMELSALDRFNGIGGFDGETYCILLGRERIPPAPWSSLVASENAGALLTERGGGFAWNGSSRSGRITPFRNDTLYEGWGWMFYLADHENRRWTRLLPGDVPNTDYFVRFAADECGWQGRAGDFAFEVRARATETGVLFELELSNLGHETEQLELVGLVDWLMGTDAADAAMLRVWAQNGACFASGAMEKVGCWMADSISARPGCARREFLADGDLMSPRGFDRLRRGASGWTLCVPVKLRVGEKRIVRFALEAYADTDTALERVRAFRNGAEPERFRSTTDTLRIETPDAPLNALANTFLPAQNLNCRIRARTGLYQPGGAFGFRDQLQDMLPLIYTDPRRVRQHILDSAARQFAAGDVLHWWHPPYTGVRTDIRDDLLFLPYVTAKYVRATGDAGILRETVPFLADVAIPEGKPDLYAQMLPCEVSGTLHAHCMRAIRRAAATGTRGLCEMGGGDWNDGMNRVGGESVWLTEFLAVCAERYAEIAPEETDRTWLSELNECLKAALEEYGWGGDRYLRAYARAGAVLGSAGSAECAIDGISQAWAVFAGLDENRCRTALDTAWRELVDEKTGVIRLLHPPFAGKKLDPGYIAAYPPGIRENGGQYTHAACWLLIALIRMGEEERAHRALEMLLPYTRPVETYRGEPYVMAADVCADALHPGRAGWTWYTGSAAWMRMAIFELLGFERRGNRVRICALLGSWEQAGITLKYGNSAYRLISRRNTEEILLDGRAIENEYVTLIDDGHDHTAIFPVRKK